MDLTIDFHKVVGVNNRQTTQTKKKKKKKKKRGPLYPHRPFVHHSSRQNTIRGKTNQWTCFCFRGSEVNWREDEGCEVVVEQTIFFFFIWEK